MFNSEDEDGMGLLSQNHETDLKIDLSGKSESEAIEIVDAAIMQNKAASSNPESQKKIWFYFKLADGSAPTLFAPIGKLLRNKIKDGAIVRAMPAQNGGWIIRL